ncbi:DinB family protein [Sphingobacterium sp. SRCM116780]|uniref:DinB family protein n=1 Tax=Sphingobacterium sp. SRCM116780 TaxID=2907623 RepID=UPI001F210ECA|nr:DinB family protein [Sphingobacterium sp. SRCM116780]UIR57342.1 DinB family protein [Sphingobacterium sp. SRCM116780]
MTKEELIETFYNNHQEMIAYVNSLTDEHFIASNHGKWTAGQQFHHVYLVISAFPKILSSKEFILQKFGKIDRPTWSYDTVIENYFKTSRQSAQQFLPEQISAEQKVIITNDIQKVLQTIQQLLGQYTDEELDTLVIPSPLLGPMTIREMFYLMSYHATHHLRQTQENLEQRTK